MAAGSRVRRNSTTEVWDRQIVGVVGGVALMVLVVCALPVLLPLAAWRSWREWRRLARQGRVMSWREASKRAAAGTGAFVVSTATPYPYIQELWFVAAALRELDPDGEMPRWTGPGSLHSMLKSAAYPSRASQKRLNAFAPGAARVRFPVRARGRISDALKDLPAIRYNGFASIASSGKIPAADPFDKPFADSELEALRLERERLLDLQEEQVRNAEYEAAADLKNRILAIEQTLRDRMAARAFNSSETASGPTPTHVNFFDR